MKEFKAAVIGCGRIGAAMEADRKRILPATHAGAFRACRGARLAALVDPDPATLERARKLFPGVPVFSDPGTMLEEIRPDIVSVATPPATHAPLVKLCASSRVPAVVCEKPIASTVQEGKEMIAACRRAGSLLFINHTRRFDPLLHRARVEVAKGKIGEVLFASAYYTAGLFNTGTHLVDLLRSFLGDVASVTGVREPRTSVPKGDIAINGWLAFRSGVPASLHHLEVKDYSIFEVRLYGRKGLLTVDRFGFTVESTPVRDCIDFAGYKELDVDGRVRRGGSRSLMGPLADHVVACLRGREKPFSRGEDGLEALRVLLALEKSAEKGGARIAVTTGGRS